MVKLVLLPGMDGTGDLFAPFLAALGTEQDVTVVRYPTNELLDYSELETVAREALPAGANYVLLGESFSGPVAVSIAASQPPGLIGLVLCCTFVRNPRPFLSGVRGFLGRMPAFAPPVALVSKFLLGRFATKALHAALAESLARVSPVVMRSRLQAVLSVDVSTRVKSIAVPTLYLRASQDRIVPRSASEFMVELRPRARLSEVNAPHFLLQVAPKEAAHLLRAFMQEMLVPSNPSFKRMPDGAA